MTKIFLHKKSGYYHWKRSVSGTRFQRNTKLKDEKAAIELAKKWDELLAKGDLSFMLSKSEKTEESEKKK